MKAITNVEVERYSYRGSISMSCHYDGAKYHVWIDPETRIIEHGVGLDSSTLHKNSIAGRGEPGYFPHRSLKATSKFSQWLIGEMFAVVNAKNLFAQADETLRAKEAEEKRQHEIAVRIRKIQAAGPKLYDALKALLDLVDNSRLVDINNVPEEPLETIAAAREAIAEAERD